MCEVTGFAIDTSKSVFTIHAVDAQPRVVLRRNPRRQDMTGFFGKLAPVDIAIEAGGASHHWGRTLQALGHRVRLIPPHYVKPFVKRGKNDRNDAEAISEAAVRPDMPRVPVKSAGQQAGNERLRCPLVLGATAVIQHAKPGRNSEWLLKLLERKPRKLAAVALANKMARIVWAMMTSGEDYRTPKLAKQASKATPVAA